MGSLISKLLLIGFIMYIWSAKQTQSMNIFVSLNAFNNYSIILYNNNIQQLIISLTQYRLEIDKTVEHLNTDCLFFGQIDEPVKCRAIISICNHIDLMSGILAIDGKVYVIKQYKTNMRYYYRNVSENRREKRELSKRQFRLMKQTVDVCANTFQDTTPKWYRSYIRSHRIKDDESVKFGEAIVELAVYVDQYMLIYHNNNLDIIKQIVTISVAFAQTALQQSNIDKHIQIKFVIKHFQIFTIENINDFSITDHLYKFCNDEYWYRQDADISVLFSGANLWYVHNGQVSSNVIGFANLNSACKSRMNCIVLEGRTLKSARTLAHEIGHSFGISHDGDYSKNTSDCDQNKFIMSATFGGSKTEWSECSVRQMRQYFLTLQRDKLGRIECFKQNSKPFDKMDLNDLKALRPGLSIDVNKQCQISFGNQFKAYKNGREKNICNIMYCWSQLLVVTAHPALEGTKCAHNSYCKLGLCIRQIN